MARAKKPKAPENLVPIGYIPEDLFDPKEVAVYVENRPNAVINLVDVHVRRAMEQVPQSLRTMSEMRLRKELNPDEVTCRLRISFWDEYQAAQDENRKMLVSNIMRGVTYSEYFYKHVIHDPRKMAWIICPPGDYMLALRDSLHIGVEKIREILSQPLVKKVPRMRRKKPEVDANGQIIYDEVFDYRLAALVKPIVEKLLDRIHGAVAQKLQSESKNLHVHVPGEPLAPTITGDLADIDRQLTTIQQKLNQIPDGHVVDVEKI